MSVVTSVVLHMSCCETPCDDNPVDVPRIADINRWLAERGFSELVSVEESFGGSKHPQTLVYGAGFNGFPNDEFASYVVSLDWINPENVALLINPESGPVRIFRVRPVEA